MSNFWGAVQKLSLYYNALSNLICKHDIEPKYRDHSNYFILALI